MTPTLGAAAPVVAGGSLELRVTGATGASVAILAVGGAPATLTDWPLVGTTTLVAPPLFLAYLPLGGAPGEAGTGDASLTVVVPTGFAGTSFYHQAFVLDPGGAAGLVSQTNGLHLAYP